MIAFDNTVITLTSITEKYGVSKKLIEKYLKNPRLVRNPHNKWAAPMRLYPIKDVEEILLKQPDVQEALKKRVKRQASARKAVKTKVSKMTTLTQNAIKGIKVSKVENIRKEAIDAYNKRGNLA